MDDFYMHLAPLRRLHPHAPRVSSIGHATRKSRWVDHTYHSMNFSFVFAGEGRYRLNGSEWAVRGPCVLTQWPDVHVEYGPDTDWHEMFLIYETQWMPTLIDRGFADAQRPVWYIHDGQHCWTCAEALHDAYRRINDEGWADRVDRICENMILESLLGQRQAEDDHRAQAVRAICSIIEADIASWHDFHAMAARRGLSPATFRRQWAQQIGPPPAQYLTQLRIRRACRLLSETSRSVHEIAVDCGFEDPLYFSRKFRQVVGQTASDYRRQHRIPTTLDDPDER